MKKFIYVIVILFFSPTLYADATYLANKVKRVTVIAAKPMLNLEKESIGGTVSRSALTKAVVNREPVDTIGHVTNLNHLYFFTELKGFMGEKIFHRWIFNGKVIKETEFEVGGPRWRVWSSNTILPELFGEWKVSVVDATGRIIREAIFDYMPF